MDLKREEGETSKANENIEENSEEKDENLQEESKSKVSKWLADNLPFNTSINPDVAVKSIKPDVAVNFYSFVLGIIRRD